VPGEGGLAGVRRANARVRDAKPTLLLATPSTHILLRERLGESAAPDAAFAPLGDLGRAPNVLLVSARLGVATTAQLVERAKSELLVYASAGAGQTIHLCTAYFCELAGIRMTHRPYDRGSANAYADLLAGRVQVYFDNLLGCREFVARGDVIPLAVSADARNRLLPDVPTLGQCGFPEHALDIWFGVFGAGLGSSALRAIDSARSSAALGARLADVGLSGEVAGGPALSREIAASLEGWQRALGSARKQ
jgi:tripartite-type tricarboxylate transporter receptor subunit TctC